MSLAVKLRWTQEQIKRMDPDYLDELVARLNAEAKLEQERRKKRKPRRGGG